MLNTINYFSLQSRSLDGNDDDNNDGVLSVLNDDSSSDESNGYKGGKAKCTKGKKIGDSEEENNAYANGYDHSVEEDSAFDD